MDSCRHRLSHCGCDRRVRRVRPGRRHEAWRGGPCRRRRRCRRRERKRRGRRRSSEPGRRLLPPSPRRLHLVRATALPFTTPLSVASGRLLARGVARFVVDSIQQQRTSPSADITDPYGRSLMHQQGQRSAGPYVTSPSSTTHHKAVLAAAAAAQRSRRRQSAGGASGNAMERLDALAARARSFPLPLSNSAASKRGS